jgi:transcriptional regulator with XRE-family HTH domain
MPKNAILIDDYTPVFTGPVNVNHKPTPNMIATNLKQLRAHAGLNQTEFGKLFDASRGMIDTYESGRSEPSYEFIKKVAEHFKISLDIITYKDLAVNPGYIKPGAVIQNESNHLETIRAKDEMISMLKRQVKDLQTTIDKQGSIIEKLASK